MTRNPGRHDRGGVTADTLVEWVAFSLLLAADALVGWAAIVLLLAVLLTVYVVIPLAIAWLILRVLRRLVPWAFVPLFGRRSSVDPRP